MSRSNPNAAPLVNPCTRWFQWDSDKKCLKYYDKEADGENGKKGANIFVKLPFQFIVLDVLNTVSGFSDNEQTSFYSNEVRNFMGSTKSELLVVRLKKNIVAQGSWEQIKDKVESQGGKFANSVYIGYFDENKQLKLGNIKLSGAAIGSWIGTVNEMSKSGKKIEECAFKIADTKEGKKGKVTWNEPVFTEIKIKDETNLKAIELDKQLQEYLSEYLKRNHSEPIASTPSTSHETPAEVINQQNKIDEPALPVVSNDFDEIF